MISIKTKSFLIQNKYVVILVSIWIIMVAVVNPFGEFPLNDDWAYSKDVLFFYKNGFFSFVNWPAMSLIAQITIGTFFCNIFGFSFTLLRILTLITGIAGVLTSYKILEELTLNKKIAFYSCLIIIGNPLYFSLSNTFMTDVYFFTFVCFSILFFNRSFKSGKFVHIILATLFITTATLIRQIGFVIPAAYAIVFLYKSKPVQIISVIKAFVPLLITWTSLLLYNFWITKHHSYLSSYETLYKTISNFDSNSINQFYFRIGATGIILGLSLFPVLILQIPEVLKTLLKKENRFCILITAVFIFPFYHSLSAFPIGNIFYNFGLGPKLLKDAMLMNIDIDPMISAFWMNTIKIIGFSGALLLIYVIAKNTFCLKSLPSQDIQKSKLFAILILIFIFATYITPKYFFDRYLIQLIIPIIIIILPVQIFKEQKKILVTLFLSVTVTLLIFSTCLTHDYFSWNKARWKGINYLINDKKIEPDKIDGGFEFNGWNYSESKHKEIPHGWWFTNNDDFLITFGPVTNYNTIQKFPYIQYLPFKEKNIYVLQKK